MRYKPLHITASVLFAFFLAKLFFSEDVVGFIVPALLFFVPLLILPPLREPLRFGPMILATFFLDRTLQQLGQSLWQFLFWVLIIFPPYLVFAHFWMIWLEGMSGFSAAPWAYFLQPWPGQLLLVALPEEFFFRGYLQGELNRIWKPKWELFGVKLGWSWIIVAAVFAPAHSIIHYKWWHFSIFFPALVFGYLRERCGSITAPILFHAFSNVFMNWFASGYFR